MAAEKRLVSAFARLSRGTNRYRLAESGSVEWLRGSRVVATVKEHQRGRVCVAFPNHDAYTIYRMRVRRGQSVRPAMEVHFKAGPKPRILGIIRVAR